MFAVVNGKLEVALRDERGHAEWLRDDYGIHSDAFEHIIRGYVSDYKITV